MGEFSLRELMNLLRFKPDPEGNDAGPVIKPNAGSGLTQSLENLWKSNYNLTKQKLKDEEPIGNGSGTPWGLIASLAAGNVLGAISGTTADYKANDLLNDAGYSNNSVRGIGYTLLNAVDKSAVMDEYNKNTVSQLFRGNLGGFLTRTFWGSDNQKEQIRLANQQAERTNMFNRSVASTTGIRNDLAMRYGNNEDLVLLTANGKDENGGTWALTKLGEVKADGNNNLTGYVGGIPGKDTILDYVGPNDTVFTQKNGHAQRMWALMEGINKNKGKNRELAQKVANPAIEQEKNMQKTERMVGALPPEKVARADLGIDDWGNILTSVFGVSAGLGLFFQAKNSKINRPNFIVNNPYASAALDNMAKRRINPLPIINEQRAAEARGRRQLATAGGLNANQRALANIALTANTLNSIAQNYGNIQLQNNQYGAAFDQARLSTGESLAERNSKYGMAGYDYYAKGHAAKIAGMWEGIKNALAQAQQGYKNYYTSKMGNNMYNLYAATLTDDQKKWLNNGFV